MSAKYVVRGSERGVTSLFIVIFAAILLSIITVSFIAMMVREQQRSTDNELSQSAYDAALAGVEDGKRVMIACRDGSGPACNAIAAHQCTTVIQAGIQTGEANGEVILSSSTSTDGRALDQAYTCVIVRDDTEAYIDDLFMTNQSSFQLEVQRIFQRYASRGTPKRITTSQVRPMIVQTYRNSQTGSQQVDLRLCVCS